MKTRVLIIHNDYAQAGGERQAVRQERELFEQNGHEVALYERDNAEIDRYGVLKKAAFFPSSIFSGRTYRELRALVRQFKPDVAHVHNVFPLITPAAYWALKHEHVPIIQTVHNFRLLCPNALFFRHGELCELCKTGRTWNAIRYRCFRDSRVLSALYASILTTHRLIGTWRLIDRFIALNKFTAAKLVEGGIADQGRVSVLGNFTPYTKRGEGPVERAPYVAFAGRLAPEKGLEVLIDAAARVPQLGVKILGEGPSAAELKARAAPNPNIEFLGWLDGALKFEVLAGARAVVLPSLVYEQFNMVILEAFSVATPIIASRLGGIPFIVEDGVDSLLFSPGDADALAVELQKVVERPEMLAELGQRGRQVTLPRYAESAHYARLLEIQAEVIHHERDSHDR